MYARLPEGRRKRLNKFRLRCSMAEPTPIRKRDLTRPFRRRALAGRGKEPDRIEGASPGAANGPIIWHLLCAVPVRVWSQTPKARRSFLGEEQNCSFSWHASFSAQAALGVGVSAPFAHEFARAVLGIALFPRSVFQARGAVHHRTSRLTRLFQIR